MIEKDIVEVEEELLETEEVEVNEIARRVFRVESGSEDDGDTRPIGKELETLIVTEISFGEIKQGDYFILVDQDKDGDRKSVV